MSSSRPFGSPQWQKLTEGFGTGGTGGGIPEAPTDGQIYGRRGSDASWQVATSGGGSVSWDSITGKPVTFPPSLPIPQSGVTNLVTDLGAKAPIDSPVFTGNPTAPTPTAGDSDASVATTSFVTGAVTTSAASKQPLDATLTALAGLTGVGLVEQTGVDIFAKRDLGVAAATSVPTRADGDARWQALDSELTALAGLVSAADRLPYFTGTGTASLATFTGQARLLLDDPDAATMRTTLGLTSAASATPAALSKTDDTNVTLTLSGTPASALLQATGIAAGWSGTLSAARGGFGMSVAASSGVPLFATGVPTFTGTTGTGVFARAADPVLSGVPTTPTAAPGTSTLQIASTAFVGAAVTAAAVPSPATVAPLMAGVAAVGTTVKYAREDHKHPTDTSREATIAAGTTAQYYRGDKSWQALDKASVGLGNVDNTSDANKPVSTAGAAADALRVLKAGDTMSGDLTIDRQDPVLHLNSPYPTSTVTTGIETKRNSLRRWYLTFSNDVESGGNSGSDIALFRSNDAGGSLGSVLSISRSTGLATITGNPTAALGIATKQYVDGLAGGVRISDTAPAGPSVGQQWWRSSTGASYVYYDDGAGAAQWVQTNSPGLPEAPINTLAYVRKDAAWVQGQAQTALPRNRIVNPAMQISQENGNTAGTAQSYYAADQWNHTHGGPTGVYTSQRVQSVTSNGSVNRYRETITTADAAAASQLYLAQWIEGVRVADFRYGTASAKQSILRFGWKSPAGTYSIRLLNGVANRSYIANFTVSAGQANVDTEQTFVIPGDTTGAWLADTGGGIHLSIAISGASTAIGVAGWQAGAPLITASNTKGTATVGNIFELFDVGLYLDAGLTGVAPRWEMPDEAQELTACQRYWETVAGVLLTTAFAFGRYAATKRITPALSAPTVTAGTGGGYVAHTHPGMGLTTFWQSPAHSAVSEARFNANARM